MTSLANIRKQAQRGFTLVELLIVVIILAILAAIVVPQFGSSTDDAKLSALDSNLSALRSAVTLYKQQHGDFPGAAAATGATCPNSGTAGAGAANSVDAFTSQMTMYTNAAGQACSTTDGAFKFGPYIKNIPSDPIKNVATVAVATDGALNPAADSGNPGGWKVDVKSGRVINNNGANLPNSTTAKYSDR